MSCERVRPALAETLTGAADPGPLRDHLEACAACRAELAELQALEGRLRKLPLLPRGGRSTSRAIVAAAAVVFLAVAAWLVVRAPDGGRVLSGRVEVDGRETKDLPPGRPFAVAAPAALRLSGGAVGELDAGTRGECTGDGLRVLAGGGRFRAGTLRLMTPTGRVSGAGAEFLARQDASLAVSVFSGQVTVDYEGRPFLLSAGQKGEFGGPDPLAEPGQDERYDRLLKLATLSLAQALPLAAAAGGGTAIEAELEEEEGLPMFAVIVAREGKAVEVMIDATNGKAVGEPRERRLRKAAPAGPVDLARAVDLALRASPGAAVNAELEEEEGTPAASVRVYGGGKVVRVHLDATTGRVLKVAAMERRPGKKGD